MTPFAPEIIAALLLQAGLDPEAFNLEVVSDDLAAYTALYAGLDDLLADREAEPDTRFAPGWDD